MDIGRNHPCHCGSGKKYKKCCQAKDEAKEHTALEKQWSAAQKAFEKEKKEAEDKTEEQQAGQTPKPGATPPHSTMKSSKHSTMPAPKFNMPRRTGGG
jgi:hypothetical protein